MAQAIEHEFSDDDNGHTPQGPTPLPKANSLQQFMDKYKIAGNAAEFNPNDIDKADLTVVSFEEAKLLDPSLHEPDRNPDGTIDEASVHMGLDRARKEVIKLELADLLNPPSRQTMVPLPNDDDDTVSTAKVVQLLCKYHNLLPSTPAQTRPEENIQITGPILVAKNQFNQILGRLKGCPDEQIDNIFKKNPVAVDTDDYQHIIDNLTQRISKLELLQQDRAATLADTRDMAKTIKAAGHDEQQSKEMVKCMERLCALTTTQLEAQRAIRDLYSRNHDEIIEDHRRVQRRQRQRRPRRNRRSRERNNNNNNSNQNNNNNNDLAKGNKDQTADDAKDAELVARNETKKPRPKPKRVNRTIKQTPPSSDNSSDDNATATANDEKSPDLVNRNTKLKQNINKKMKFPKQFRHSTEV